MKIDVDWYKVEDMKKRGYTWQQIGDAIGVTYETKRKRAYKHGLKQKVPFQLGKRRCSKCGSYFPREELVKKRFGLYCDECAKL